MSRYDDASDDEWQGGDDGMKGRYPVHDACEFGDAEALRALIHVALSDASSVSSDNSSATSGSTSTDQSKNRHVGNDGGGSEVAAPVAVAHGSNNGGENSGGGREAGQDAPPGEKADVGPNDTEGEAVKGSGAKKKASFCPYDLDERDDDENTPLHIAIHARKLENVRILLEAGVSVHKKCDGSAPIHLAISLGAIAAQAEFSQNCVALLKEYGADLAMRDDSFHTPLYLACVSNLSPIVDLLLSDPLAIETINAKADRVGGRALHAAARCDIRGKRFVKGDGRSVTEALLSTKTIELDTPDNYGRTPLHIAASCGNWHVARLLLSAGADAHHLDKQGVSPGRQARKRGIVVPNDLQILSDDAPTRDMIMDPDGETLILCHELCIQHRTCPPIARGDSQSSEPPPENVRRLSVLINNDDGILRGGEFGGCKWFTDVRRASLCDVLRVHEYSYIERTSKLCSATPDHPRAIRTLDADTTVSHWSFEAALRAAGSVCEAVDRVVAGDVRNAFCAIRPPGHHAGPRGIVTCPNDPDGSHGFCLLNNIAIGASYARSMYRNDGIKKVAIIDFDVHHGNGTEEIVRHLTPCVEQAVIQTPFAVGGLHATTYKPWLDENDVKDVFFASTHGYGPRDRQLLPGAVQGGWFYPASGKTFVSQSLLSSTDVEVPAPSDFLLSQTWARLGDDYRRNCCKIIDVGFSLPPKDSSYHHGIQRLELRDAYRKRIIPSLIEFDPDMIFISAGFDAHRKDTMNFGYIGMVEEDYEWLTLQLIKVANTCCNGRVISALEGGYKIHGGIVSPFARSVASHVRALVDGGNSREKYDADDAEWEGHFERHMNEEKEKRRQMKMAVDGPRERPNSSSRDDTSRVDHMVHENVPGPGALPLSDGPKDEKLSKKRARSQIEPYATSEKEDLNG